MSLIGQSCLQTMIMCQKACAIQRVLPHVYTVMRQSIIFASGPLFKMLIKQNKYVFAFSNAVHSLSHVEFQLGNLALTMILVWILKSVQNRQVCTAYRSMVFWADVGCRGRPGWDGMCTTGYILKSDRGRLDLNNRILVHLIPLKDSDCQWTITLFSFEYHQ